MEIASLNAFDKLSSFQWNVNFVNGIPTKHTNWALHTRAAAKRNFHSFILLKWTAAHLWSPAMHLQWQPGKNTPTNRFVCQSITPRSLYLMQILSNAIYFAIAEMEICYFEKERENIRKWWVPFPHFNISLISFQFTRMLLTPFVCFWSEVSLLCVVNIYRAHFVFLFTVVCWRRSTERVQCMLFLLGKLYAFFFVFQLEKKDLLSLEASYRKFIWFKTSLENFRRISSFRFSRKVILFLISSLSML